MKKIRKVFALVDGKNLQNFPDFKGLDPFYPQEYLSLGAYVLKFPSLGFMVAIGIDWTDRF